MVLRGIKIMWEFKVVVWESKKVVFFDFDLDFEIIGSKINFFCL